MPSKTNLSQRLKLLRNRLGLGPSQAAKRSGIPASYWNYWETHSGRPKPEHAAKIAKAFDVEVDWVLEGRGDGPPPRTLDPVIEHPEIDGAQRTYRHIAIFPEGIHGGPAKLIEVIEANLQAADEVGRVPDDKLRRGGKYALFRMTGDLMEPFIKKGDLILVNLARSDPRELVGQPVLAWIGTHDGATVRILEEDEAKRYWMLRATKAGCRDRIVNKKREKFQVAAIEQAWLSF